MVVSEIVVLTDVKVRNAKVAHKPYKLADEHRMYLQINPSGSKLWQWSYRFGEKQKTLALGPYPLVGLGDARDKRDEARKVLLNGIDPAAAKRLEKQNVIKASENTFERTAREWHSHQKASWALRHSYDVIRSFERDVFPTIGKTPLNELTPPIILKLLRAVEARDAIETARRIRQRISAVFVFAIASGIADSDPAEKVGGALKPMRKKGVQPAITDLPLLIKMLHDAEDDFARPITRLALRLLALTAVRPSELREARWTEFEDLGGDMPLWRIPANRMKGDLARKQELEGDHLVPLAPQSVAVLKVAMQLTGDCPLVFPSARHMHKPMSENAIGYLLNRAGYHGRHVPHGFRAAFSTIMNEWANLEGIEGDRETIDLMLAHIPANKVERVYNRAAYMERRRQLAKIWANKVTATLPAPAVIAARPCKAVSEHSKRKVRKFA
jgi:integrase